MSTPEPPGRPRPPVPPPTEPLVPRRPVPSETAREYERLPPDAPPPGSWWDSPWPVILVSLVALLAGGFFGYLIGHNSESASPARRAVTSTVTVTQPKTITDTVTSKTIKETPSPANHANEERLREAESNLRKVEKENQELSQQVERAGSG